MIILSYTSSLKIMLFNNHLIWKCKLAFHKVHMSIMCSVAKRGSTYGALFRVGIIKNDTGVVFYFFISL